LIKDSAVARIAYLSSYRGLSGSEEDDESPDPVALSRKKPITIHEMKYLKFFFIPLILQLNI
jgi:hypothetical protein